MNKEVKIDVIKHTSSWDLVFGFRKNIIGNFCFFININKQNYIYKFFFCFVKRGNVKNK